MRKKTGTRRHIQTGFLCLKQRQSHPPTLRTGGRSRREQQLGCIYFLLGLAGWEQNIDKGTGACGPVLAWSSGAWVVTEWVCLGVEGLE